MLGARFMRIEVVIPEGMEVEKARILALLALATYGKKRVSDEEAEKAVEGLVREINEAILREYGL